MNSVKLLRALLLLGDGNKHEPNLLAQWAFDAGFLPGSGGSSSHTGFTANAATRNAGWLHVEERDYTVNKKGVATYTPTPDKQTLGKNGQDYGIDTHFATEWVCW